MGAGNEPEAFISPEPLEHCARRVYKLIWAALEWGTRTFGGRFVLSPTIIAEDDRKAKVEVWAATITQDPPRKPPKIWSYDTLVISIDFAGTPDGRTEVVPRCFSAEPGIIAFFDQELVATMLLHTSERDA